MLFARKARSISAALPPRHPLPPSRPCSKVVLARNHHASNVTSLVGPKTFRFPCQHSRTWTIAANNQSKVRPGILELDTISCFALYPQHRCISTAGARPNPRWLAPLIAQGSLVSCGFDADPTGEGMAHAMIALHPTVQRLRPHHHDWNDVLKARA